MHAFRLLDKVVDEVVNDSNRFNQFQKVTGKNQQQRQTWMAKRRQENEQRRANGQDELPLDEVFFIFSFTFKHPPFSG